MKCPCHIAHNIVCYAAEAFRNDTGFEIEDFLIDIFFWIDKSSKQKNLLQEFVHFAIMRIEKK